MLFNSYIFILFFLPLVVIGYYFLGGLRKGSFVTGFLFCASLCFVGYQGIYHLAVLCGSILLNFLLIRGREQAGRAKGRKKKIFVFGVSMNLVFLFLFKYLDFFLENLNLLLPVDIPLTGLVMPIGISFYTFSQIACLADCYKGIRFGGSLDDGRTKPCSFVEYGAFVSFFPKLIQGPIASHREVVPGFRSRIVKKIDYGNLCRGIYAFALGLAKKVLLADTLAKVVNIGYGNISELNTPSALMVMVSYSLQIYFDFSGYCDMAYGIGYMLNIKLPINFNSPYQAESVSDFWERWHMTLTEFFTRYLYIPLGGSRKGTGRTYLNIMIVFLLSGLWHGANWTFVLWGMLHGIMKVMERALHVKDWKIPRFLKQVTTFIIVTFAWSIFRADSVLQVKGLWGRLFFGGGGGIYRPITDSFQKLIEISFLYRAGLGGVMERFPWLLLTAFVFILLLACFTMRNTKDKAETMKFTRWKMILVSGLMFWSILSLAEISEFIYFNF